MKRFALALIALWGCGDRANAAATVSGKEPPHEKLTLDSAQLRYLKIEEIVATDAAPGVMLTGKITFDEDNTQRVASPLDGRATALLVKPGDRVKTGQPLIELSSPQVGALQAEAQKAQQNLSLAQRTAERLHKLKTEGAVSEKDVALSDSELEKAKSDVARAEMQLRSTGVASSGPVGVSLALRARVAGTVVERNVLVGQEVRADATTPLLTVSNLDAVWAVADVYERDLGLIVAGAKVEVEVPAYPNEKFMGTVAHLADVVDPLTRTVKLRCVVPNGTGRLKPEMFATMRLAEAAGKGVVLISSKAVLNDGPKTVVVVATGNSFELRPVAVGAEIDRRVRVLSGLVAGEKIVTDGALFVRQAIEHR